MADPQGESEVWRTRNLAALTAPAATSKCQRVEHSGLFLGKAVLWACFTWRGGCYQNIYFGILILNLS